MTPADTYQFRIDLADAAIRIDAGEAIRVEITSAIFSKYTRSPDTGESIEKAMALLAVTQTVHRSGSHAPYIELTPFAD